MRLTFEHLLGLPAEAALAILHASGIMDVEVVPTAAPPRRKARPAVMATWCTMAMCCRVLKGVSSRLRRSSS